LAALSRSGYRRNAKKILTPAPRTFLKGEKNPAGILPVQQNPPPDRVGKPGAHLCNCEGPPALGPLPLPPTFARGNEIIRMELIRSPPTFPPPPFSPGPPSRWRLFPFARRTGAVPPPFSPSTFGQTVIAGPSFAPELAGINKENPMDLGDARPESLFFSKPTTRGHSVPADLFFSCKANPFSAILCGRVA